MKNAPPRIVFAAAYLIMAIITYSLIIAAI